MDPLARLYRLAADGKYTDFVALLEALRESIYDVRTTWPNIEATEDARRIAGAILSEAIARLARIRKTKGGHVAVEESGEGLYG